jgi:hypothetical protein
VRGKWVRKGESREALIISVDSARAPADLPMTPGKSFHGMSLE